jgi:hypothetical protein
MNGHTRFHGASRGEGGKGLVGTTILRGKHRRYKVSFSLPPSVFRLYDIAAFVPVELPGVESDRDASSAAA